MVEYSPQILASEEKATTTTIVNEMAELKATRYVCQKEGKQC